VTVGGPQVRPGSGRRSGSSPRRLCSRGAGNLWPRGLQPLGPRRLDHERGADGADALGGNAFYHEVGKGAALRTRFAHASGHVIVSQDDDLEYDRHDWSRMLPPIVDRQVADIGYGSRFFGRPHRSLY
jgi:hypothetical protein